MVSASGYSWRGSKKADFTATGTSGRGNFTWQCDHGRAAAHPMSVTGGVEKSNCISYAAIA